MTAFELLHRESDIATSQCSTRLKMGYVTAMIRRAPMFETEVFRKQIKVIVLKTVFVTLLKLFGAQIVIQLRGNCAPLPLITLHVRSVFASLSSSLLNKLTQRMRYSKAISKFVRGKNQS